MGQKISVDSATMMNKGLEVIEAHWLFDLRPEKIDALIHPQQAIHGLVYFADGSVVAQLADADMRTPISYALAWPDRLPWHGTPLDLTTLADLVFLPIDLQRYPCFGWRVLLLSWRGNASGVKRGERGCCCCIS